MREAAIEPRAIYTHRPSNVLELLLASIFEIYIHLVADLVICGIGNANSTRLRYRLHPGRHIHTIAEQVLSFDHHITEIDPYAELDPLLGRHVGISAVHPALEMKGAPDRFHH